MSSMEEDGSWDLIGTIYQGAVKVHGVDQCTGTWCCIHNPSDHHMKTWPLVFTPTLLSAGYRVCEHRIIHPDPDSRAYLIRQHDPFALLMSILHECDGCCDPEGPTHGQ